LPAGAADPVDLRKLDAILGREAAKAGAEFQMKSVAVPPAGPKVSAAVPAAGRARGEITFVGMAHATRADIDIHIADLQAAYERAEARRRPLIVLVDDAGPDVPPPVVPIVRAAIAGYTDAVSLLRQWFLEQQETRKQDLQQTEKGVVSPSWADHMMGIAAWAAQRRVSIVIENIRFDDWLKWRQWWDQTAKPPGVLRTEADRKALFDRRDEESYLLADLVVSRNRHIAEDAQSMLFNGADVVLLLGSNHDGVKKMLASAHLRFREGRTSHNADVFGYNLVVQGWMARKPVVRKEREKLYLADLVMTALYSYARSRNGVVGLSSYGIIEKTASAWKPADLDSLLSAFSDGRGMDAAVDQWLKRQGNLTPEQKSLFHL